MLCVNTDPETLALFELQLRLAAGVTVMRTKAASAHTTEKLRLAKLSNVSWRLQRWRLLNLRQAENSKHTHTQSTRSQDSTLQATFVFDFGRMLSFLASQQDCASTIQDAALGGLIR